MAEVPFMDPTGVAATAFIGAPGLVDDGLDSGPHPE